MEKLRFLILTVLFTALLAGTGMAQSKQVRNTSTYGQPTTNAATQLSMRIEQGKVWVNGNLIPKKELPHGLQELHPDFFYQAKVYGRKEIPFSFDGRDYVVKAEKIVELPPRSGQLVGNSTQGPVDDQAAMEEYYSQLKRDSPGLFYSMTREANLTMQARELVYKYQFAAPKEQNKIREELRDVLSQLFDINERNRELEIEELQQMIDAAQKEIEVRKVNKDLILDNTLDDLVGE